MANLSDLLSNIINFSSNLIYSFGLTEYFGKRFLRDCYCKAEPSLSPEYKQLFFED